MFNLSPGLAFSRLIPQLFDLSSLLEDFQVCTFDQNGHFLYPDSLNIERNSIVSKQAESLYLLFFRSTFFFITPHLKPDKHLLLALLGPNYSERMEARDLDTLLPSSKKDEVNEPGGQSFAARLRQMISVEEASSIDSIRTRLAIQNSENWTLFFSIIDEFSNIQIPN